MQKQEDDMEAIKILNLVIRSRKIFPPKKK